MGDDCLNVGQSITILCSTNSTELTADGLKEQTETCTASHGRIGVWYRHQQAMSGCGGEMVIIVCLIKECLVYEEFYENVHVEESASALERKEVCSRYPKAS